MQKKKRCNILHLDAHAPLMLCVLDSQGHLVNVDDRWLEVLGYAHEEVIGHSLGEFLVEGSGSEPWEGWLPELLRSGQVSQVPCQVLCQDGQVRDVLWSALGESDATGGVVRLLCALVDVTDSLRAEQDTQRQLQRLLVIRQIDQVILTSQNLNHTLSVLLAKLLEVLQADAAAVLLLNPFSQTLEYAADVGFQTASFRQVRLRLGEDFAGQVALQRKPIYIPDLKAARGLGRPRWAIAEGFFCYWGLPLICESQLKGVLEVFHRTAFGPQDDWLDFLETLAGQAAIAVHNASLLEGLQTANVELIQAYNATIEGWSRALELRDLETMGHCQRVTEMSLTVARAMGVDAKDLEHIRRGAMLHDIGKMGIPDGLLLKPGSLSDEEWAVMRQHPQYAYQLLSSIPFLKPALDIPLYHHEKWDGSGYPHGLEGERIPLAARIFAVVDVWDALCHDRPYHHAWEETKILAYLREQAGSAFDPKVVEVFVQLRQTQAADNQSDS